MVRLIGAPALALALMTAASPAADAAYRYYGGGTGYRQHHAGMARASRRDATTDRRQAPRGRYALIEETVARRKPFRPADRRGIHDRRRVAGSRPRVWCGWYARGLVGQDPGPAFNLARNWARWGHAARPGVGVMVVWAHHVGMITGRTAKGAWIVKSGNDGHAVRERPRSLAGAIAFRAS